MRRNKIVYILKYIDQNCETKKQRINYSPRKKTQNL